MSTLAPLGRDFYARAVTRLQRRLQDEEVDGILVLEPHNLLYLSGFHYAVNERPVGLFVPQSGAPVLFVPQLEHEHAASASTF